MLDQTGRQLHTRTMEMKLEDLHWLVGLLEGEGCFTLDRYSPVIKLLMTDKDVVERAAALLGNTKVSERKRPAGRKTAYATQVFGSPAIELMKIMQPLMGLRRKQRIEEVLVRWYNRPGITKGSRHGKSKLKDEYIPLIRELGKRGIPIKKLSEICGVGNSAIERVLQGKTWKHVKVNI